MPTWGPTDCGAAAATTSSGLGAGLGPHCPVGTWSGTRYRSGLRWQPPAWSTWTSITKATLKVKTTDFAHVGPRNSTIFAKRMTVAAGGQWEEGSGSQNCNNGFSASNATQYDDLAPVSANAVSFQSGTTENSWKTIDVTALIRDYWNARGTIDNISIILEQQDSTDYAEFWSNDSSGNEPTLQIDYVVQSPPTAPTLNLPQPSEVIEPTKPTFYWTHNDPQNDAQAQAEVSLYDAGGVIIGSPIVVTGTNEFLAWPNDLVRGTSYQFAVRTADAGGWGPQSAKRVFTIKAPPTVAIDATRYMEWANGAPRLRVKWTITGTPQTKYQVICGAFDSGWLTGAAVREYLLDAVNLTDNTAVSVTVNSDGNINLPTPIAAGATRSFTPRYGLTVHRRDLITAPLNWGSPVIVATVPVGATLRIEYGSDPAANAAPASGWLPDLASVPKQRYLFWRAWFIPSATASPILDSITISSDSTAVLVDKWGTTRDIPGLTGVWAIDPGEAVYGTRSMRADVSGAGPFTAYAYGVPVKAGRSYILTGLMKSLGNSGAQFRLEDGSGNILQGGGVITPPGPVASDKLIATSDWFTAGSTRDVNRYKTPIWTAPANMTVYVVLVAGGTAGAKAWWDALKLEESTVATPWSPGAIGAVVIDAGGVQIDGNRGGVFRYKGTDGGVRSVVGGGTKGLLFAGDTELESPSVGLLNVNAVPVRIGNRIPPVTRLYTASATWTKPTAGLSHIVAEVIGGGGGGGGAQGAGSGNAEGGGGGAGAYARHLYTAEDLAGLTTCAVVVGGGGTAGSNATGGPGGLSNFSGTGITTLQGTGGSGGSAGASTTANNTTGAAGGGVASGPVGAFLADGASGGRGTLRGGVYYPTNNGGSSFFGGGGTNGSATTGEAGQAKGSGGGGSAASTSSTAGGVGAAGLVIVTEYYL